MNFEPGTDIFIHGVFYDTELEELEIYSCHYGWWGILMTSDEASFLVAKLKKTGVFFYNHVRHVQI